MGQTEVRYTETLRDDVAPLDQAITTGLTRPLVLWGHPEIGQGAVLEAAAAAARIPYRLVEPEQFESWEGYRDISESGHFREFSLEKFLARGERGDPETFRLEGAEVLYLRDINLVPSKLLQAVFDQLLSERKLLNNPIPPEVRIVASCRPPDRHAALDLLGEGLRRRWEASEDPPTFKYPVFPLPGRVLKNCDHWAILPSLPRFLAWGRSKGLAEEVLRFLEDQAEASPEAALAILHDNLLSKPDLFHQLPSPRAFAEFGSLLVERRLYFSSRAVKDQLASAQTADEFSDWFHRHAAEWEGDRWIESEASLTVRGDPVPGSVWLNHMKDQVKKGEARIPIADLPTYAAYERRTLEAWATQELGDDLGREFVTRSIITDADVARLKGR